MGRRTVLLVDDDGGVRRFASRTLTEAGYEVVTVEDGLAALSWLAQHTPDLILTDFVMPRMNGWMLIKALDTRGLAPKTPVVVMSTLTDKVGQRLVQMTRVDECIRKPFGRDALLTVVRRHVTRENDPDDTLDTGDADDTWIVMANVQEMVQSAVAEALADHVDELVEADTRTKVLSLLSDVLSEAVDERFAADLLEVARDRPITD